MSADVDRLVETVLVGIDSTDFGSGEKERRSAARAALDQLVLEHTRQEEALREIHDFAHREMSGVSP